MRAYFFGNYYLSQIQQGIQALHCAVEIQQKYQYTSCDRVSQYGDWARNHKTVVLLNGGNQESLLDLYAFLQDPNNSYAFSFFKEDEQSLNLCVTCVGIILPARIYEGAAFLRGRFTKVVEVAEGTYQLIAPDGSSFDDNFVYSEWDVEFMKRLNEYRLA